MYSTRYLGLLWHILGTFLGILFALAEWDYLFWLIFMITGYFLELAYTQYGAGAVKYYDPEWTQSEDALYPFTV